MRNLIEFESIYSFSKLQNFPEASPSLKSEQQTINFQVKTKLKSMIKFNAIQNFRINASSIWTCALKVEQIG